MVATTNKNPATLPNRRASQLRLLKPPLLLLIYTLVSILALRGLILRAGMVGRHWDWSMPFFPELLRNMSTLQLSAWFPVGLGAYVPYRYGTSAGFFFLGLPGYLGLDGEFTAKAFLIVVLVASGYGMYRFCRELVERANPGRPLGLNLAPVLAGLLYMLAPYQYNQVISGDLLGLVAYAAAPHAVFFSLKGLARHAQTSDAIKAGLIFGLVADCSVQPYLLLVVTAVPFAILVGRPGMSTSLRRLAVMSGAFFAAAAFWVLPMLVSLQRTITSVASTTVDPSSIESVVGHYSSLHNALTGTTYFVRFFLDGLPQQLVYPWQVVVLVAVALAIWATLSQATMPAHKTMWLAGGYWAIVYVLSAILASPGTPIGSPIEALYAFIPWQVFFRTPQHLVFMIPFSIAVIGGLGLAALTLGAVPVARKWSVSVAAIAATCIYCLGFFLSPSLQGYLGPFEIPAGQRAIEALLNSDHDQGARLLSLPGGVSRYFTRRAVSNLALEAGDDGEVIWSTHPVITPEIKWSPSRPSRDFQRLVLDTMLRHPDQMAGLLNLASVKYIEVTPYFSPGSGPDYFAFNRSSADAAIAKLPFVKELYNDGAWSLYENESYSGRLTFSTNVHYTSEVNPLVASAILSEMTSITDPILLLPGSAQTQNDTLSLSPKSPDLRSVRPPAGHAALQGWHESLLLPAAPWNYFDGYGAGAFEASGPGDAVLSLPFRIALAGDYDVSVAGLQGPNVPPLRLSIDTSSGWSVPLLAPSSGLQVLPVGKAHLSSGTHTATITAACTKLGHNFPCEAAILNIVFARVDGNGMNPVNQLTLHKATSSGEYLAQITAHDNGVLVLRDSFDEGWMAAATDRDSGRQVILQHVRVSGFANGWLLPAGNWSIRLYFAPQDVYNLALLLSVAACGMLGILMVAMALRRHRPFLAARR